MPPYYGENGPPMELQWPERNYPSDALKSAHKIGISEALGKVMEIIAQLDLEYRADYYEDGLNVLKEFRTKIKEI